MQRSITALQIVRCVQMGTITEGPFINKFGNWQMNLTRHAAGEQITCNRDRVGNPRYRHYGFLDG